LGQWGDAAEFRIRLVQFLLESGALLQVVRGSSIAHTTFEGECLVERRSRESATLLQTAPSGDASITYSPTKTISPLSAGKVLMRSAEKRIRSMRAGLANVTVSLAGPSTIQRAPYSPSITMLGA
jgi:hypothetical protein